MPRALETNAGIAKFLQIVLSSSISGSTTTRESPVFSRA